jgi:hypothetical protein
VCTRRQTHAASEYERMSGAIAQRPTEQRLSTTLLVLDYSSTRTAARETEEDVIVIYSYNIDLSASMFVCQRDLCYNRRSLVDGDKVHEREAHCTQGTAV